MVTPIDQNNIYNQKSGQSENLEVDSSRINLSSKLSPQKKRAQKYESQKRLTKTLVAERSFSAKFSTYTGEELHWIRVIFRLLAIVTGEIYLWVIWAAGYALMVSLCHQLEMLNFLQQKAPVIRTFVLSLNIVLSLLLAFRTNTAHERFWEGRKLWGAMVNTVRNLAREIWLVIEERDSLDRKHKEAALRLVVAFPIAMKLHLRREALNSELIPLMNQSQYKMLQQVNHAPLEIAFWVGDYIQYQHERERVNGYQLRTLHKLLDKMVDILGGCERILKTPVPLVYTIVFKTLLLIYFLVLPLLLVQGLGWWTAPVVACICILFLTINEVGAEIEEPFGHDPNDLPLDLLCETILRNVEDLIQLAPSGCAQNLLLNRNCAITTGGEQGRRRSLGA